MRLKDIRLSCIVIPEGRIWEFRFVFSSGFDGNAGGGNGGSLPICWLRRLVLFGKKAGGGGGEAILLLVGDGQEDRFS